MTTTRTPPAARADEATRHRALLTLLDRARLRIPEAQGRWAAISELTGDSGGGWHDVEAALRLLAQHGLVRGRSDRWHGTRGSLWQRTAEGTRWTRSRSTALPAAPAVSATIERRARGPAVLRVSVDGVAIAVIVQHDDAHGWVAHDANVWGRPDRQLAVALQCYAAAATAGVRADIDTAAKLNRRYPQRPVVGEEVVLELLVIERRLLAHVHDQSAAIADAVSSAAPPRPCSSGEHPVPHDPANQRAAAHDGSRWSA